MTVPPTDRASVDWSLYLVTDPSFHPAEHLTNHVLRAIKGGVSVVQLRDKQASDEQLEVQARALARAVGGRVPIFVNDRVQLARTLGLHLHIGQSDMPYVQARQLLPEYLMIGLSIENRDQLERCIAQCAAAGVRLPDVVGLGPLVETPTKPDAAPALGISGITELAQRASEAGIASVAIGGIQVENAAELATTGVNGVCVVSALMGASDPEQTAARLRRLFTGVSSQHSRPVPNILSIAGTDPSGGAGASADLKSIAAAGGYGMSAITALVAQNTLGVRAIEVPPTDFLRAQLDAVSDDVRIDAVKIGMLGSVDIIDTVAAWLDDNPQQAVVLDPVMIATSGDRLLEPAAEEALRDFSHRATVLTPNTPELAILAQEQPPATWDEACQMARRVAARYGAALIVKSGHLTGSEAGNAVVTADGVQAVFSRQRLATANTHGTGCSLSSALATRLGAGDTLEEALSWVTAWLHGAIDTSDRLQVGAGHGPVNHFWNLWAGSAADTTPVPLGAFADATAPAPLIPAAGPHTAALWELTGGIWERITALPFIRQLADGTLSAEDFTFYQDQDALYLREYSRALALLSAKAPTSEQQVFWARGAAECITVESLLHGDWLGADYVSAGPSPVTRAYTDFLTDAAGVQDYAIAAAAVLPCYWLYAEIGELLAAANRPDHPYTAWLSMYGSADFRASVEQALAYIEAALEVASPQVRSLATQAYQQASAHELHFFDQAHRRTLSV
ncbi:bifunctional hydroxymethylpyrimidine kinase/phosphomethylpyrimidine kinase [Rothia nasisuis]|uniref:bifunctional hydroxymethylpyrimidine kinase/phosphomethylpyrimidine kinase n=1 Tax=Rothia nasisuis TaxID=2109647 RepID=UPI001F45C455|nr:bifunctional hydroxymethylpyrimidine kinase/phosphomethylpyrimidine kinase [Rothia nasisuis]